ncbi:riboflavin kinase [Candidatus Gracilibacteria bacterium]|nr:riboflavin kinase [Candidatus Gracilibacteria bacterium]
MKTVIVGGHVVKGSGIGKQHGLPPTMNIEVQGMSEPLEQGIYVVQISETNSPLYNGVAHFGPRPAVNAPDSFEVHCFDFDQDWYGKKVAVQVLHKLREIENFASIPDLAAAIDNDITEAKKWFAR